ncbi:MAG: PEP-CTERM sorting domain-containing protein [Planctomycetota bacterium]|nr:PEP-CTERM sorting domain-containing protein [Planctomycetota bacterium]
MKASLLNGAVAAVLVILLCLCSVATAVPHEPLPHSEWRSLRTDHVKTWYIFNDSQLDGILNPGDTHINTFDNWWSPVSAHTQHNYDDGPYKNGFKYDSTTQDMPSGPMNFATSTLPAGHPNKHDSSYNYWLPTAENEMHFYMTYSQYDNNNFDGFYDHRTDLTQDQKTLLEGRNEERNGWAFGWVTNDVNKDGNGVPVYDGTPGGKVKMDIYIRKGNMDRTVDFGADGMGLSRSNPQISMSNDISYLAKDLPLGDDNGQWHPPTWDDASGSYKTDSVINTAYKAANGLTDAEFDTIVASMEDYEVDPDALGAGDVIHGNRTPSIIEGTLTDHNGNPYVYADAFLERSDYVTSTTDGGVIAGLSGWDEYDPQINNWGDQQVIRIDISKESLKQGDGEQFGNIQKLVFYDFGYAGGSTQVAPRAIVFYADADGDLYYLMDDGITKIYFPENRIYIARVVPEPGTMILLAMGGIGLLLKRKRK